MLKTKDNEIEVLKRQIEDSTREMDKSRSVIDALNRAMQDSK